MIEQLNYLYSSIIYLDNFWLKYLIKPNINILKLIDKKLSNLISFETIYPNSSNIFRAIHNLSISQIKVVILGQDPYHGENEAIGYSFATNNNKIPPSLCNIYKELAIEYNININSLSKTLLQDNWVPQGVMLLNTILTVSKDKPKSHDNIGWEIITNQIIRLINDNCHHVVFLLWGRDANQKSNLINSDKHLILSTSHPSPFSAYRGFIGCNHFKKTNQYFIQHGIKPIDWV